MVKFISSLSLCTEEGDFFDSKLNTDLYHESKRDLITNFKKWAMEVLSDAYDRQFSTNGLLADTWEEQRAITKT